MTTYKVAIPDEGPRLVAVDADWESTDTPVDPLIARAYRAMRKDGLIPGSVGFIRASTGELRMFDYAVEDAGWWAAERPTFDLAALFARSTPCSHSIPAQLRVAG